MSEEKKLSIIIPVYNLESYISLTIESVLAIRFSYDYEILLINDGSTDSSEDIIKNYQNRYTNIRLITIPNGGVSNARNVGIHMAVGEYITFVDGDDTVDPDFYQIAIKELDEEGYDFVQGNFKVIEHETFYYSQKVTCPEEITDKEKMMIRFLGTDKKIHNNVWCKIYRADVIKGIAFDRNISIAEDQKFVFDVIRASKKIKLLDCDAYNYYQRNLSATHTADNEKKYGQIEVCKYMETNLSQAILKQYGRRIEILVWMDLYTSSIKQKIDAREYYKEIKLFNMEGVIDKLKTKERIKFILIKYMPHIYEKIKCIK